MQKIYLNRSMSVSETMLYFPKCDNGMNPQHDGSTIRDDFAHQGERVREALRNGEGVEFRKYKKWFHLLMSR